MNKKQYSKIDLFIRSALFSIYSVITMPIWCMLVVIFFFLPLRCRHRLVRVYVRFYIYVLKKLCRINYVVEGLENIPKDRVGIVMSKHQSTWETYYLSTIFHAPAFIAKRELFWVPFFGWALALSGPIAINRSKKALAMQQLINLGTKILNEGRWVIVFPEGTRTESGTVGNYRPGGARLAAATGFPIIPVAHNAGRCWPRRKFIKQPGTITVVIGSPIESKGRTPEELLDLTKTWIEETMKKIDTTN